MLPFIQMLHYLLLGSLLMFIINTSKLALKTEVFYTKYFIQFSFTSYSHHGTHDFAMLYSSSVFEPCCFFSLLSLFNQSVRVTNDVFLSSWCYCVLI